MVKLRPLLWTLLVCSLLAAQTTLTQIRDTVTNSDGSPFNGTVVITWNGFTGSSSNSTPLSTSARIYNGALSVLLVPTTTASAGSFYQVVYYNLSGVIAFSETWQVPPSTTPLGLSTVRTSSSLGSGSAGGSGSSTTPGSVQYATLPISMNQISGLSANLAGINAALASLAAQVSQLNTGAVSPGTSAVLLDAENPSGTLDGTNTVFNLSKTPSTAGSVSIYRNGLLQSPGIDYNLNGTAITFLPVSIPKATDTLSVYYRVPGTASIAVFTDAEVPAGNVDGSNVTFSLVAAPSPALSLKLFKNGVLQTQNIDYTISGGTITFSANVIPQSGDALLASYRH